MKITRNALFFSAVLLGLTVVAIGHTEQKEQKQQPNFLNGASLQNGEKIYMTGYNTQGRKIPVKWGPHWLYMHGGGCLACHGEKGKGGKYPHMCSVKSPAITYKSLFGSGHTHGSDTEKGHKEEEHEYTFNGLRKTLEQGIEPDGELLNPCMPRWKFEDQDFRDLVAYLMFLDQ
ncbi:MAG: c-type cytochrome [Deltaproteobacteria bacterium]|nr:c-type cytochrome [Deltaproteobacteria bacterium]MBW2051065.1 c-type cytochrome [Deltaproteobacteria bacterium]MBW2141008.1 c-type cytochrome [Deltaproteobacteria bacterium]MBW2322888.1 c-type cytochrome [Deltaproteobacteria bacterium]